MNVEAEIVNSSSALVVWEPPALTNDTIVLRYRVSGSRNGADWSDTWVNGKILSPSPRFQRWKCVAILRISKERGLNWSVQRLRLFVQSLSRDGGWKRRLFGSGGCFSEYQPKPATAGDNPRAYKGVLQGGNYCWWNHRAHLYHHLRLSPLSQNQNRTTVGNVLSALVSLLRKETTLGGREPQENKWTYSQRSRRSIAGFSRNPRAPDVASRLRNQSRMRRQRGGEWGSAGLFSVGPPRGRGESAYGLSSSFSSAILPPPPPHPEIVEYF